MAGTDGRLKNESSSHYIEPLSAKTVKGTFKIVSRSLENLPGDVLLIQFFGCDPEHSMAVGLREFGQEVSSPLFVPHNEYDAELPEPLPFALTFV